MSRRKLMIGLRSFLLVTTIGTAVLCTLFLWYRKAAEESATVESLRRMDHRVYYECDLSPGGTLPTRDRTRSDRLLSLGGDSAFFNVELVIMPYDSRDAELDKVCRFTKLKQLSVTSGYITDDGTRSL